MALGTRYPYGRRSDSGAPMNERYVRAVRSRRCSNAESTTPGSSAGTQVPWSVFSPSMASFLKRTANASFVPRLLVDRSFYVGQRLSRSSRLQFEMLRADHAPSGRWLSDGDRCRMNLWRWRPQEMKGKPTRKGRRRVAKAVLRLPDLEVAKSSVLNSLSCPDAQRGYRHDIDEFVDWYCSEPRLSFSKTVVVRYRMNLESRHLAPGTINLRLGAVRRLAYEAADCGLLSADLAAGIRRVKGVKKLGVRLGNWLTAEQAVALWQAPD